MVTWAEEAVLPEGGAAPTGTLGKGLTKARPVFPQLGYYSCTSRRGRSRRPKVRVALELTSSLEALKGI